MPRTLLTLFLLVILQSVEHEVWADEPTPKKNYLLSVIANSDGLERDFFTALQKQKDVDPLLGSLGILQLEKKVPFGTMQAPGQGVEPLHMDEGEVNAINFRRKLAWHQAFEDGATHRQLLIFDPAKKSWPGMQAITIVLVDAKMNVLAWLESGGVPMFEKASFPNAKKPWLLEVTSLNRNNNIVIDRFEVSDHAIKKIENVR